MSRETPDPAALRPGVFRRRGRLAAGVSAGAVLLLVPAFGVAFGVPTIDREPVPRRASVSADAVVAVCPAQVLQLGQNRLDAAEISGGEQTVTSVRATLDGEPVQLDAVPLASAGQGGLQTSSSLILKPSGDQRPTVAAAASVRVSSELQRGSAAVTCQQPLYEGWIVGGSTATGNSDLIAIGNPGATAATVTLEMAAGEGATGVLGVTETVVAPGGSMVIPLASLAAGAEQPVLHFTATGSAVSVILQSSAVEGLTPIGLDYAVPQQLASSQVIPSLRTIDAATDGNDATAAVRLFSPDRDTAASVQVVDTSGQVVFATESLTLVANDPVLVPVGGLAAGSYRVNVTADHPIAASAMARTLGASRDFAWLSPSPAIDAPTVFAVPGGGAPRLHVAAGDAPAEVTVTPPGGGQPTTFTVEAGRVSAIEVSPNTAYQLTATATVYAGVTIAQDGSLAGITVPADVTEQRSVTVYQD